MMEMGAAAADAKHGSLPHRETLVKNTRTRNSPHSSSPPLPLLYQGLLFNSRGLQLDIANDRVLNTIGVHSDMRDREQHTYQDVEAQALVIPMVGSEKRPVWNSPLPRRSRFDASPTRRGGQA